MIFRTMEEKVKHFIGMEYLGKYQHGVIEEETPAIKNAYSEISKINEQLFDYIPFDVVFTSDDMYTSAKDMRERVQKENKIYIYDGWEGHPYLTLEENLIGRAVHDVWSHLVCGCPFNFEGELTAYYEQRNYYPEWTWNVLFGEIPAQTAAYYVNGKSHQFKQRAIKAPMRWTELAAMLPKYNFSSNSVLKSLLHD